MFYKRRKDRNKGNRKKYIKLYSLKNLVLCSFA